MIVTVSTKTLSAREPDHSASTKPIEITSKRGTPSTSSMVGTMIALTVSSVNACEASRTTSPLKSSTRWSVKVRTK